jgi:hypothetical protein
MAKSYTEELAAWVEKRAEKKRRQDAAAVAFMAVKSDVVAAMEAGYALTTIWEHMHETGKVKCSYETFRKHVHRFIRSAPVKPAPLAGVGRAEGWRYETRGNGCRLEEARDTQKERSAENRRLHV